MLPGEGWRVFITSKLGAMLVASAALIPLASLTGCGNDADPELPATQSEVLARGVLLSYACQACHTLGADGGHQIGPNLFGVFGREAGTAPGFVYSEALRTSGIVWSPAELDGWLADPAGFLPGTTMAFTGYQSADDRDALIDYLVAATSRPPDQD